MNTPCLGQSPVWFHNTNTREADVEIFAVGVKDAVRSKLEAIANTPAFEGRLYIINIINNK